MFGPSEEALNWTISESSVVPPMPGTEPESVNDIKMVFGPRMAKASMVNPPRPTSEPSK